MIKQVQSIVHQLGKEKGLSELYGGAGQDLSLEEQKHHSDWHMVNGVETMTPHVSLYTMRGDRKRDHPPTSFTSSPGGNITGIWQTTSQGWLQY